MFRTLNKNRNIDHKQWGIFSVQYVTSTIFENVPKHFAIVKLARLLSYGYEQLKYSVRIINGCVVGGWREMETPQCYFNMKLLLDKRKLSDCIFQ